MSTHTETREHDAPITAKRAAPAWAVPPELDALIRRVERHQEALGVSDERFVGRYKLLLKTVDSWTRTLKRRDPERLTANNAAKWTAALRKLAAYIDGAGELGTVYAQLPILRATEALYDRLQGAVDDRRVAWIVAVPGAGKTTALRYLRQANPAQTAYLVSTCEMNGNKRQIAREFARAIGSPQGATAADTMDAVVEHLRATPLTVLVDEFHEGGVLLFKTIKNIVNKASGARFILATLPTAYKRMVAGAGDYEETRQLRRRSVGLVRKQWADGLRAEDIDAYIAAAAPEIPAEDRPSLTLRLLPLCHDAALALLADAIETARASADAADTTLNEKHILRAAAKLAGEV